MYSEQKRSSKNLLKNHRGYYLPPLDKPTCQYLRDFLVGKKLLLKLKDVDVTVKIHYFEEFRARNIWQLVKDKPDFKAHFPDIGHNSKSLPDRDYLLNIDYMKIDYCKLHNH